MDIGKVWITIKAHKFFNRRK